MIYPAKVKRDGVHWLVAFPDCPGCQTDGASKREAIANAREALEGWLEAHLAEGRLPPRPSAFERGTAVEIEPRLSILLQLRWARADRGLNQTQLAKRVGVSQQAIAKLESPDANPTIETLVRVADALGLRLDMQFRAA